MDNNTKAGITAFAMILLLILCAVAGIFIAKNDTPAPYEVQSNYGELIHAYDDIYYNAETRIVYFYEMGVLLPLISENGNYFLFYDYGIVELVN